MVSEAERAALIQKMRALPEQVEALVTGLDDAQLDAHSPGAWSVRQIVHHLADSHMNLFIRLKLTLTEENPTVKTYIQDAWVTTPDVTAQPITSSLAILKGLHARFVALCQSLTEAQWARPLVHPEAGNYRAEDLLRICANHGEAHLRQIQETLAAGG